MSTTFAATRSTPTSPPPLPASARLIEEPSPSSDLPRLLRLGAESIAPAAPKTLEETGVEPSVLLDLTLKLTSTVPHLTTDWAAAQLRLPPALIDKMLWQLKEDQLVEILGQPDEFSYRYAASGRGREYARRLFEISGYIGPAPVSLRSYAAMLELQVAQRPKPSFEEVREAISGIVLPESAVEVAALAAASGRSLFLFGPPGNGKTSLGRLLHGVMRGELWIPHCISLDSSIIRIFDRQVHRTMEHPADCLSDIDARWQRIHPPFVVAGGEMTIDELDLAYSPAHRFYEAPPHLKANGGTFLIDDFGRQRVDPHELLNRWIIPLEHRIDHLTLNTGQKIEVPFRLMLIVATNLTVSEIADPAFLRRMGYRLHLNRPTPEAFVQILEQYAAGMGLSVPPDLAAHLVERYRIEGRELRASEPRDLLERVRDICQLHRRPLALDDELLATAWAGYFGHQPG